jgi:hypothetical protein
MVAISLTRRGVVTLGDHTNDGVDGQAHEDEKGCAHCVDVLSRSVVVRARRWGSGLL